jgi:hypothetical protein
MSHNKRHGTAESQLRVIPKLPRDTDRTMVDVRPAPPPSASDSVGATVAFRGEAASPPECHSFTKPRAIAALAAANPDSVVIRPPSSPAVAPKFFDAPTRVAPPIANAPVSEHTWMRGSAPQSSPPATRVATGWTPPGAVPIVKPAPPVAPVAQVSQTLYPMPAPTRMPASVSPVSALPAPVIPVPALHMPIAPAQSFAQPANNFMPITTQRPASQMPIAAPAVSHVSEPQKSKWAAFEALARPAQPQWRCEVIVSAYRLLAGDPHHRHARRLHREHDVLLRERQLSCRWRCRSPTRRWSLACAAEQQNTRDRIATSSPRPSARSPQQAFQAEFAKVIRRIRRPVVGAHRSARRFAAPATRRAIKNQSWRTASASRRKMAKEYAAALPIRARC